MNKKPEALSEEERGGAKMLAEIIAGFLFALGLFCILKTFGVL